MAKLIFKDPYLKMPRLSRSGVPIELRPFQYKMRRPAKLEAAPFVKPQIAEEFLLGIVHGKKASALEERFATALDEAGLQYVFQYAVYSAYSIPHEERNIDFMVFDGPIMIPVEPGAGFIHKSPSKAAADQKRTQILNEVLQRMGIREIIQLEPDEPRDLDNARELVHSLFMRA